MNALPFLSFFTIFDSIQGVCSGILRGTGKQNVGAFCNVFAFYALGLPMAWAMAFRYKYGVIGLMMGISFGVIFQVIALVYLIKFRENYIFSSSIINHDNNQSIRSENVTARSRVTVKLPRISNSVLEMKYIKVNDDFDEDYGNGNGINNGFIGDFDEEDVIYEIDLNNPK